MFWGFLWWKMEVYLLCIQNTKTDQKVAFQNDNNFWCKPKYILTVKWQKSNIKPSIYKLTGRASSVALIKFVIFVSVLIRIKIIINIIWSDVPFRIEFDGACNRNVNGQFNY